MEEGGEVEGSEKIVASKGANLQNSKANVLSRDGSTFTIIGDITGIQLARTKMRQTLYCHQKL